MKHWSLVCVLFVLLALACLAPRAWAQTTAIPGAYTWAPAISGDGRIIAAVDGLSHYVHVLDRSSATWTTNSGVSVVGHPSISADGRYVAFQGNTKCYVWDRQTNINTIQSVPYSEYLYLDGYSHHCVISADGLFLAFVSEATTLVPNDTNGVADVFVRDIAQGVTTRVSVGPSGSEGDAASASSTDCVGTEHCLAISGDGTHVAFSSDASNLVAGDTNNTTDVFVHDRRMATTARVSVAPGGEEANNRSAQASITSDGRYVAFVSAATNLVPVDVNHWSDIFIHDRQTGVNVLVSLKSDGTQHIVGGDVRKPQISGDGRFVAFEAEEQLDPSDGNLGQTDVYLRDVSGSRTFVVSAGSDQYGLPIRPNPGPRTDPTITADGRYVLYRTSERLYLFDRLDVPLVADAGDDQTVDEQATVVLNGSASTGTPPLTYLWEQFSGTAVTLADADTATPSFTAPTVGTGGETLSFRLTVTSGDAETGSAVANVTVINVNRSPFADAGEAQTVSEGSAVTLHGDGSYDPDGDQISFSWRQTAGIAVTLRGSDTPSPGFVAPEVGAAGGTLTFELTVNDGATAATDVVSVTVRNENVAPVADAGVDQAVAEGTRVVLDGTASRDPDGGRIVFDWTQLAGPTVVLDLTDQTRPAFTAPDVGAGGAQLEFRLIINDQEAASAEDTVVVTVLNVYDPPNCNAARGGLMWPPNHALVPVTVEGVIDADPGNRARIAIDAVTQDEPIDGVGDGDTSPDAVVVDGQLYLRAERAGTGDGRVYHVSFTAYGLHGSCLGVARFAVPHSKKAPVIDGGPLYFAPVR